MDWDWIFDTSEGNNPHITKKQFWRPCIHSKHTNRMKFSFPVEKKDVLRRLIYFSWDPSPISSPTCRDAQSAFPLTLGMGDLAIESLALCWWMIEMTFWCKDNDNPNKIAMSTQLFRLMNTSQSGANAKQREGADGSPAKHHWEHNQKRNGLQIHFAQILV